MTDDAFRQLIWDFHRRNRRSFEWREHLSPYGVLVSELMLQQTQTSRVADYYPRFLEHFPDFSTLADAPLASVLEVWQGLGYNRRARFLHQAASRIQHEWGGVLPADEASLRRLPGIGPNTAASILAFAFNLPTVFIETNIRTVFLHHYYPHSGATDKELLPLVARTLDRGQPREWYYALTDYGVHLKRTVGNASRRSPHHVRQTPFAGSVRQVRGAILKALLPGHPTQLRIDRETLYRTIQSRIGDGTTGETPLEERFAQALAGLVGDGLVAEEAGRYGLPD